MKTRKWAGLNLIKTAKIMMLISKKLHCSYAHSTYLSFHLVFYRLLSRYAIQPIDMKYYHLCIPLTHNYAHTHTHKHIFHKSSFILNKFLNSIINKPFKWKCFFFFFPQWSLMLHTFHSSVCDLVTRYSVVILSVYFAGVIVENYI